MSVESTISRAMKMGVRTGGVLALAWSSLSCSGLVPDGFTIATECQGQVKMGEIRGDLRRLGYYNDPRGLTEEQAYNNATCGPEGRFIVPTHTVVPCGRRITWRDMQDEFALQHSARIWDGRALLKAYRDRYCPK